MTLLKAATHVVADVAAASAAYARWLDYAVIEQGQIPTDLAAAWGCPASAGRDYAVLQPASGAAVFLRFVAGDPLPDYQPLRTFGWAATEICVTDVAAVNDRMAPSPFEVIGPPKPLDGFEMVIPMQVRGPDSEIVFLTQMPADGASLGLPVPHSLIDRPFIMVLACPDLPRSIAWTRDVLGLEVSAPVAIRYTMIEKSFGLSPDDRTEIATAKWTGPDNGGDVIIELDQYPAPATPRPRQPGALPPGVAIVTMLHPDFTRLDGHWRSPPVARAGPLYGGRLVGVLETPEGALLEVIDAR